MKKVPIFSLILMAGIMMLTQCQQATKEASLEVVKKKQPLYGGYDTKEELGKHLVAVAGCHDCHTPKKMGPMGPELDMERSLSGHPSSQPIPDLDRKELESKGVAATQGLTAWVGPWGVSFTGNITSDPSGIGNWTLEQFKIAVREGKYKGILSNRSLLPPMPLLDALTDEEVEAIFAYLKSTKPVNNVVPQPMPPLSAMPN